MRNTLIVIAGPTASGKTGLAIRLAKAFRTEIISADSRQFYKEIPIGTAAPSEAERSEIPHHFVGHLSIRDDYNVSKFEQDVLSLLVTSFPAKNPMIMAGGSGLYIDAVCKGIDDLPEPDPEIRKELQDLHVENGIAALQQKLISLDPAHYETVDIHNPKRLMRAIEVCLQTGKPYSEQRKNKPKKRDFRIVKIGLYLPREVLSERIARRTLQMLDLGWLDEAREVFPFRALNALNTVGYKELFAHFDRKYSLEEAIAKINTTTRRYAKRQMTWFNRDPDIKWFHPEDDESILAYLGEALELRPET